MSLGFRLAERLLDLEDRLAALAAERNALLTDNANLVGANKELFDKALLLGKERDDLREAMDRYREAAEGACKGRDLLAEKLRATRNEIAELNAALDVEREQAALMRESRAGLKAEMEAELADLRKHLADRGGRIAALEAEGAELRLALAERQPRRILRALIEYADGEIAEIKP